MRSQPIRAVDDLYSIFYDSEKPKHEWRVGIESEKFGVHLDGTPVSFGEIETLFADLVERYGWQPETETEGGPTISLARNGAHITLEPSVQLELSGAPHRSLHDVNAEFVAHLDELQDFSAGNDIAWLGLGFHPFAKREDLPWVPKLRYAIMREYLPTRGRLALDMMQRTCTVQANLDYSSEEDAMLKLRAALRIQPIVTAMFANSPCAEGSLLTERTRRGQVWLEMDPDRCGLLPFAWSPNASYEDYVQWALDAPMFLIKRGGNAIANTQQTFRQFMQDGMQGHRATVDDWEMHLRTLFPEVRLKNTLECRGADSQNRVLSMALPALWKGLLYDEKSLFELDALTSSWNPTEVEKSRPDVCAHALSAKMQGRWVRDWAMEIVDIATRGLEASGLRTTNAKGQVESVYLEPLRALVEKGECPADAVTASLSSVDSPSKFPSAVIAATRM